MSFEALYSRHKSLAPSHRSFASPDNCHVSQETWLLPFLQNLNTPTIFISDLIQDTYPNNHCPACGLLTGVSSEPENPLRQQMDLTNQRADVCLFNSLGYSCVFRTPEQARETSVPWSRQRWKDDTVAHVKGALR